MRQIVVYACCAACLLLLASARPTPLYPQFSLKHTGTTASSPPGGADWERERVISGAGWTIASGMAEAASTMRGGYTVIHREDGLPLVRQHCYVLAAWDYTPTEAVDYGWLLVTVRDPEYYWDTVDPELDVVDPVELVWLNQRWEEVISTVLDFPPGMRPDSFRMAPDERSLLAVLHPVSAEDSTRGDAELVRIMLDYGTVQQLATPTECRTAAAGSEYPLHLGWTDDGRLLAQVGDTLWEYTTTWH
jgi:hypothetical protein